MHIAPSKLATLGLAAVSLAATLGATAQAAPAAFATDMDYLRAARCQGIAQGVGADTATLAAYLKAQGVGRASYIVERGEQERLQAKRQAKGYRQAQLQAELTGACGVYSDPGKTVAAHGSPGQKG